MQKTTKRKLDRVKSTLPEKLNSGWLQSRGKCAVIPSTGIGDALLMMVASHSLFLQGYEITTYTTNLNELSEWFHPHHFKPTYSPEELQQYDLIILQNNDSKPARELIKLRDKLPQLSVFYPTYKQGKHAPLTPQDRPFHAKKNMVENIAQATATLIDSPPSTSNGLTPPAHLTHRRYPQRIVLQPCSTDPTREWLPRRYLALARALQKRGFQTTFALTQKQQENPFWARCGLDIPHLPTLSDLASHLFESGFVIGNDSLLPHLASNLEIPHLVIGHLPAHMQLWKPGWHPGVILMPPSWVPNLKGLRLRDSHWQYWITTRAALRRFDSLLSSL